LKAAFGRFFDGKDDFSWRHAWLILNAYTLKRRGLKRLRRDCVETELNRQP
jgi:hypothetical protein